LGGDPPGSFYLFFTDPNTLIGGTVRGIRVFHAPSLAEIEATERMQK
jgi:hypothetical protein